MLTWRDVVSFCASAVGVLVALGFLFGLGFALAILVVDRF
jgi:hypothetical protein